MDSVDGQIFVKNLAYFVQKHETALANALCSQRHGKKHGQQQSKAGASQSAESLPLHQAQSRPYLPLARSIRPAKLTLTPHHLYFLLSKFEDVLGQDIGHMNVRLENLQRDGPPSNYVSFLGHAPKSKGKQAETDSLRSVSSVRSVMSSMSSLWSSLTLSGSSAAKAEKQMNEYKANLRYLYSCFTKIPALKLSPDRQARLIEGFEEFPFDTAVPLLAFKNVSALEICDLDFRQFHGWDRMAEQLRSLTLRRANVDDPLDLLHHIVLDDGEGRRKRSFKTTLPTTPSTPGVAWPMPSPRTKHMELQRTWSAPHSTVIDQRRGSTGSPIILSMAGSAEAKSSPSQRHARQRSDSPARTPSSKQNSLSKRPNRTGSLRKRRTSGGSSESSANEMTPRHSSTDLLGMKILPPSKWQFLRHLSLADNGMTYLNTPSLAPVAATLQSLDLSGNLFTEVPDALASLTNLRALNLSNCMIGGLQSLARNPLPAITTLNLRSNRLVNLSGIERLLSLERVDLRDNRLRDPVELARLTGIPEITDLYVVKNPFTKTHANYRITILNLFRSTPGHQQDVLIDYEGPKSHEKAQLVDRVAEPPSKPVVRKPLEHEVDAAQAAGGAATESELSNIAPKQHEAVIQRHGHRRSTSDMGPRRSQKKKGSTPSRLNPITQPEDPPKEVSRPASHVTPKQPSIDGTTNDPVANPVRTPGTPDILAEAEYPTPYHTAPTTRLPQTNVNTMSPPRRPHLDTAFTSPTPGAPRIRDPSDDDDSPLGLGHSEVYRKKIEGLALRGALGAGWLGDVEDKKAGERTLGRKG